MTRLPPIGSQDGARSRSWRERLTEFFGTVVFRGPVEFVGKVKVHEISGLPTPPSGLPAVGSEGDVLTTVSGAWTARAPSGGTSDTHPVIVASFAAKGLTGSLAETPILAAPHPAGKYRMSVALVDETANGVAAVPAYTANGSSTDAGQTFTFWDGSNGGPFNNAPFDGAMNPQFGSSAEFDSAGADAIGFSCNYSGSGTFKVSVTLERLPDSPGTAALYYLNATSDAGSVVLTPTGPTFAKGTSVSVAVPGQTGTWSGDVPSGHETDNPLTLVMDAAKSLAFAAD
jgi:hypothetical protein